MNYTLTELDAGQLDTMFDMIRLRRNNSCTKKDVQILKEGLDVIRQMMIQKTGGYRKNDPKNYYPLHTMSTALINAVMYAMALYIYGGLDVLEAELPEK